MSISDSPQHYTELLNIITTVMTSSMRVTCVYAMLYCVACGSADHGRRGGKAGAFPPGIKNFSKKRLFYWVSSGKKQISPLQPPPGKNPSYALGTDAAQYNTELNGVAMHKTCETQSSTFGSCFQVRRKDQCQDPGCCQEATGGRDCPATGCHRWPCEGGRLQSPWWEVGPVLVGRVWQASRWWQRCGGTPCVTPAEQAQHSWPAAADFEASPARQRQHRVSSRKFIRLMGFQQKNRCCLWRCMLVGKWLGIENRSHRVFFSGS